jgi:acyl carrier protein
MDAGEPDRMNVDLITQQIVDALGELNQQLPPESRIETSPGALLLAPEGKLDSLGLVNLILLIEERMASQLSTEISLTDDRTLAQPQVAFHDVASLAQHILLLVDAGVGGNGAGQ